MSPVTSMFWVHSIGTKPKLCLTILSTVVGSLHFGSCVPSPTSCGFHRVSTSVSMILRYQNRSSRHLPVEVSKISWGNM